MLYKRIIKTDIIKAIAEYTTEEYIKEYGIDKFMQMRDIFSECAAEVIFQWLIKQSTVKDEWMTRS